MYYVVDYRDDFILYSGSIEDCERVLDENYGGLSIADYYDLTPAMKMEARKRYF